MLGKQTGQMGFPSFPSCTWERLCAPSFAPTWVPKYNLGTRTKMSFKYRFSTFIFLSLKWFALIIC